MSSLSLCAIRGRFLDVQNTVKQATDIAKNIWITPWSCSTALKNLIKKWFIYEDTNKFIFLTKLWEEIVEKANYKRNILLNFFKNTLSLNDNISNINACNIEHLLSDEVIEAIKKISN